MKKAVLSLLACAGLAVSANAQLPRGSVAPDFTLTDINGVSHNLYSYLDSGYTVIIDISAAWCGPCWAVHQSHVFNNLTQHYGPNGTIQAKKIKVLFVEGEATNTIAQLNGVNAGSTYATASQGDWVTGSLYPIIDNHSLNTPYNLGGFPTFTVICRDRLVSFAQAGYTNAMLTEQFWLDLADGCPNYPPSNTVDVKAVPYSGPDYFICNPAPSVKFQNYSTNNLTSATVKVMNGANVVATQPWTGNLAPYGVATVNIPAFSATQAQPYKFVVEANGDTQPANNASADSLFRVFTAASASSVPVIENFEGSLDFPNNFAGPYDGTAFVSQGTSSVSVIGPNGSPGRSLTFNFYDMPSGMTTEVFAGGYNTANESIVSLSFDVAYAQYTAADPEQDSIEIFVSTNCGTSWTKVWSKKGDALKTRAPYNSGVFFPQSASEWRHEGVTLTAHKNTNMLLKIRATSDYGNRGWIDNFRVHNTLSVGEVVAENTVKLFPNPAKDVAHLNFNLVKANNVQVSVLDVSGRVISIVADHQMSAGDHQISINTANLSAGVYNVRIQTEAGSRVERLTVVK